MPEFVNRSVWSPAGTRLALGTTVWPRSAKNSTKRARISAPVRYGMTGSDGVGADITAMVPNGRSPNRAPPGAAGLELAGDLRHHAAAGTAVPASGRPDQRPGDQPAEEAP